MPLNEYRPVLVTERCALYLFRREDVGAAATFLQDPEVMHAWGHAFSDEQVVQWVERSIEEHRQWGYSFMLVRLRENGTPIGRVGLRNDTIFGKEVTELGYILAKAYWGRGYAYETARACLDYGFEVLGMKEIVATIRPSNLTSVRLAERLGMVRVGNMDKVYRGNILPHDVYLLNRLSRPAGGGMSGAGSC